MIDTQIIKGRCFKVGNVVSAGNLQAHLCCDSTVILTIDLVCHQDLNDPWECMVIELLHPGSQAKEGFLLGDIIDQDHAIAVLIEALRDCAEPLLAGCVPNAHLHWVYFLRDQQPLRTIDLF